MADSKRNPSYLLHPKAVLNTSCPDDFSCTIGDVIQKDYDSYRGIRPELLSGRCIDLDALEVSRSKNQDNSMDMAIGICNYDVVGRVDSGHRLLLVELKLDCTGRRFNIKPSELENKVSHSRQVLVVNTPTDYKNVFVFPKDKLSQALSNLSKWKKGSNASAYAEYIFLDEEGLNNFLSVESDFPIRYVYDRETRIVPEFSKIALVFEEDSDISKLSDSLDRLVNHWLPIYSRLRQQYNLPEAENVLEGITAGMAMVLNKMPEGDEHTYFLDELENLKRKLKTTDL